MWEDGWRMLHYKWPKQYIQHLLQSSTRLEDEWCVNSARDTPASVSRDLQSFLSLSFRTLITAQPFCLHLLVNGDAERCFGFHCDHIKASDEFKHRSLFMHHSGVWARIKVLRVKKRICHFLLRQETQWYPSRRTDNDWKPLLSR